MERGQVISAGLSDGSSFRHEMVEGVEMTPALIT